MRDLPAEPSVIKVAQLAVAAKKHGWHGSFDSNLTDGVRDTLLQATRNDESITVRYTDNTFTYGSYKLFDRVWNVHCASVALERLQDWPDILKLFKDHPTSSRPRLVNTYRRLPFTLDAESADRKVIMKRLIGRELTWYSHEYAKLFTDRVLPPTTAKAKQYRIADVGHRMIFHFIGAQAGFRSVLLDTIIKVG
jgi:hypothetical protein